MTIGIVHNNANAIEPLKINGEDNFFIYSSVGFPGRTLGIVAFEHTSTDLLDWLLRASYQIGSNCPQ